MMLRFPGLNEIFAEPWDPDAPLRDRLIARGPAIAVLAGMILITARMFWLWKSGIIKSEPFFGSTRWNLAIFIPPAVIFTAWWTILQSRERKREQALSALMPAEPLAGWHQSIVAFDARLQNGTPTQAVDLEILRLTLEIVDAYPRLDSTQRDHVRVLWRSYESFGVYASVTDRENQPRHGPMTVDEVRRELTLESIRDQFPDARDAAVSLAALREHALAAGIDFGALAREVAELSDDTRRDAMFGSTREVLLGYA